MFSPKALNKKEAAVFSRLLKRSRRPELVRNIRLFPPGSRTTPRDTRKERSRLCGTPSISKRTRKCQKSWKISQSLWLTISPMRKRPSSCSSELEWMRRECLLTWEKIELFIRSTLVSTKSKMPPPKRKTLQQQSPLPLSLKNRAISTPSLHSLIFRDTEEY